MPFRLAAALQSRLLVLAGIVDQFAQMAIGAEAVVLPTRFAQSGDNPGKSKQVDGRRFVLGWRRACVTPAPHRQSKAMTNQSKSLAALLVGFAAAGFAPPPPPDVSPARMAAIATCTKVAYMRFPDDDDAQRRGRYLAYKECMTEAGEAP